ncbi:MAG TPA: hypothetical protein PK156_23895 [Polyangium sp.]|nr:hypothetical protein [Polyangium sp.]
MLTSSALRDALVAAMLPAPGGGLPAAKDVDLADFWKQFDSVAPFHLRLGFRASTIVVGGVLPYLLGYCRSIAALDQDKREDFLRRAAEMPTMEPLVEILKIVVAFGYFNDPHVENVVRGRE